MLAAAPMIFGEIKERMISTGPVSVLSVNCPDTSGEGCSIPTPG